MTVAKAGTATGRRFGPRGNLTVRAVTLGPNELVATHRHDCSEFVYVTAGTVIASRGRAQAELETTASAYLPRGVFHGLSAGPEGARLVMCHVLDSDKTEIATDVYDGSGCDPDWENPNVIKGTDLDFRWAVLEEFVPWTGCEPTKGNRQRIRYLFTPMKGAQDAIAGIAEIAAHTHYTRHWHEPAEFYHVLEGTGTVHVDGRDFEVEPGDTVFVPARAVHGIDTDHDRIRLLWMYNLTEVRADWTWQAVEPIWDKPKPSCCYPETD